MTAKVFDNRVCELGEGPFWHPLRQQFFWFDILGRRLLSQADGQPLEWGFDRIASAAGWIDRDTLLIATETDLSRFDIDSGQMQRIVPLEQDDPATRCNDGRADRQGGFWIGTMGKRAETGRGAIYRYYRGELRQLFPGISIPNAICFAPDGQTAYFADTPTGKIWAQALDEQGWPQGEAHLLIDLTPLGLSPDGAVTDADGAIWCALWGAARVQKIGADGQMMPGTLPVGGLHSSCPAFGGADLDQMLVTTAQEGITAPDPAQGLTYLGRPGATGLAEPQVIL